MSPPSLTWSPSQPQQVDGNVLGFMQPTCTGLTHRLASALISQSVHGASYALLMSAWLTGTEILQPTEAQKRSSTRARTVTSPHMGVQAAALALKVAVV